MNHILEVLSKTADTGIQPAVFDGALHELEVDELGLVCGGQRRADGGCTPTVDECCRPIDSCD